MKKQRKPLIMQYAQQGCKVEVEHFRLMKVVGDQKPECISRLEYAGLKDANSHIASYGDLIAPGGGFCRVTVTTPSGESFTQKFNCPKVPQGDKLVNFPYIKRAMLHAASILLLEAHGADLKKALTATKELVPASA